IAASFVDIAARALWRRPEFWLALAIAFSLIGPNLIWNATNNLATLHHTWGNIIGAGLNLNPLGFVAFVGAQFGVCGPVAFATFLWVLARPSWFQLERTDRIMIAFALPPLVIVSIGALITGAQANWAAPAALS